MSSDVHYGGYSSKQYLDNSGNYSYLPPLLSNNEFPEVTTSETQQQLPPMSSFSSLSPKGYQQQQTHNGHHQQPPLGNTNSAAQDPNGFDLQNRFQPFEESGRHHHTVAPSDVYHPQYDYYGQYQHPDPGYEQPVSYEVYHDGGYAVGSDGGTGAQPSSIAAVTTNHPNGHQVAENFASSGNFTSVPADGSHTTTSSQQHQQHDQHAAEYSSGCYSIHHNVPSYGGQQGPPELPRSQSHPLFSTGNANSQAHHSNDSQYTGFPHHPNTATNSLTSGVDFFATLGIAPDDTPIDAESLIESYNYENHHSYLTVNTTHHAQDVVQVPSQYPSSSNNSANWNYVDQDTILSSQMSAKSVHLEAAQSSGSSHITNNVPSSSQLTTVGTANQSIASSQSIESSNVHHDRPTNMSTTQNSSAVLTTTIEPVFEDQAMSAERNAAVVPAPAGAIGILVTIEPAATSPVGEALFDLTELIEETKCFKCRMCAYFCLQKTGVLNHIRNKHKSSGEILKARDQNALEVAEKRSEPPPKKKFVCCPQCMKGFSTIDICKKHMKDEHGLDGLSENDPAAGKSKQTNSKVARSVAVDEKGDMPDEANQNDAPGAFDSPLTPKTSGEPLKPDIEQGALANEAKSSALVTNLDNATRSQAVVNVSKTTKLKKKSKRPDAFVCQHKGCSVRYLSIENRDYHQKCHRDSGEGFACLQCTEFTSIHWSSVTTHLWREHKIDMELHRCEHCPYRHHSLSTLENVHKKIHSTEKNFVCTVCPKAFKNRKQLVNHSKRHLTKTPVQESSENNGEAVKKKLQFKCDDCGRQFYDSRALRVHVDQVHKKLRPHSCFQCGHSAASRSALRTHVRSHTGEKPFKCEQCAYTTSDHNSLRRHRMRHSGEKKYNCPFCDYACIQSSTYKQHLRNKHPDQSHGLMFTCEHCGFKSVNEDIYKLHLSDQHRGVTTPASGTVVAADSNASKSTASKNSSKKQSVASAVVVSRSDQDSSTQSSSAGSPTSLSEGPRSVSTFGPESPCMMQFARSILGPGPEFSP